MLKQSLRQFFRSLQRYKSFMIINLAGLSIGIAAALIIFLISDFENNFDRFHTAGDNIYRIVTKTEQANQEKYNARVPYPTAKFLRIENPELIATQIRFSRKENIRIANEDPFEENNIVFADSLFFKVFNFSKIERFWLAGNPATALSAPNTVVLTETVARRYFGDKNPIGEVIRLNNKVDVEIVALIKDIPQASHLPATMFVSFSTYNKEFKGMDTDSWTFTSGGMSYIRLTEKANYSVAKKTINSVLQKNLTKERLERENWFLQPLSQIHFDPVFEETNPSYTVSRRYLTMLLLLAGFIILIACVNYINLSTSLAFTKFKEVGIRKTIGASKKQLVFYYLIETILLTTMAALIGIVMAVLFLPAVNDLLGKAISAAQLISFKFIAGIVAGIFILSFLSGIYPALVLSGFNPITALKNNFVIPGQASGLFRKALVVFQFTTSIVLIICTIVIAKQMQFFSGKELGFNKESVIEVKLTGNDSIRRESFRTLLQKEPGIEQISFGIGAPVSDNGLSTSLDAPELTDNVDYDVKIIPCDSNYLTTYGIRLLAGRWFLSGEEKNLGSGVVVNETMVKTLGYKDPSEIVGKTIRIGLNDYSPTIIGVTKDFHTNTLHDPIIPVALLPFPYFYGTAGIRINPGSLSNVMPKIEDAWKQVYPESPYRIKFIDETLAERYEKEKKDFKLITAFSFISIFICSIGLWGLIAFVVVRKTKEIGIRKVLGASVSGIVALLSKDFLKLVVLAFVIATPIALYFMNQWLQNFAYRIDISWWYFALAGFISVLIAMITISFQAVKAALANPVHNLRTE